MSVFNLFTKFFKTEPKPAVICGLCAATELGEKPGVLQYKVENPETHENELLKMTICTECADVLDKGAVK